MGRPKLLGKTVIGIDESNNGFQKKGLPVIIAAHVTVNYQRAIPNNQSCERKILAYSVEEHERFVERARKFLSANKQFCYTTLTKEDIGHFGWYGRAKAMASLVAKAIDMYDLHKHDLAIVCHRIDHPQNTSFVSKHLLEWLEDAEIKATLEFRGDEQRISAIRKADRWAYYLAGLKFANQTRYWPHRIRKTPIDYIEDFICQRVIGEDSFEQRFEKHYK